MGIYHKYDNETKCSTWIMLQPAHFALKIPDIEVERCESPLVEPHLFLLQSILQTWKSYCENIESQVRKDVISFLPSTIRLPAY